MQICKCADVQIHAFGKTSYANECPQLVGGNAATKHSVRSVDGSLSVVDEIHKKGGMEIPPKRLMKKQKQKKQKVIAPVRK